MRARSARAYRKALGVASSGEARRELARTRVDQLPPGIFILALLRCSASSRRPLTTRTWRRPRRSMSPDRPDGALLSPPRRQKLAFRNRGIRAAEAATVAS